MQITSRNRSSSSYRITVKMVDGKVAPEDKAYVDDIRRLVKSSNTETRDLIGSPQQYVKLQGRGPRPSRRYHQALPLSMATSADVYVYDR